jgi:signal transduction histidine kinase
MSMFSNKEALSRVSHELRTPLNAILGFGELLALDELNESQRHSVEQIMAGGRHLLAVIEDLVDLSRVQAAKLELSARPVDVAAEITDAAALCAPLAAERSLGVGVEAGAERLWALADPRRLKQVLLNLISNAIKYNRPGGSLTLRASQDGDDFVAIDVNDSGIGMTEDQLACLFRPFERLDAAARGIEGDGLGLANSKALTEAMGGTLEVASTPGVGSLFRVRLPTAGAEPPGGNAPPAVDGLLAPAA